EAENYVSVFMGRSDATGVYGYIPEENLEVTVRLEKSGTGMPDTLRVYEELPAGWIFSGLTGGILPDQSPPIDATGELTFSWTVTPTLPISFTYSVTPPATTEKALFTGMAQYRIGELDFFSNEAQTWFRRFETLLEIYRTTDPYAYMPGDTLDMTIHYVRYGAEKPLVFGYSEMIPPGWTYQGIVTSDGPAPVITPALGTEGLLEFAWIDPPPMPGSFTYQVAVPLTAQGQAVFSGYGLYRFSGQEEQTAVSEVSIPQSWP
ncbi:MAG: hypothetical protein KAH38_07805, partial [Candidatus Hydrogenedentes bacterium]|nr:hypothetical protein [Candidatus Hydrogenedentota bacterium]